MSKAKYLELIEKLQLARLDYASRGVVFTQENESEYVEQLGDYYWKMSEEEQDEVEKTNVSVGEYKPLAKIFTTTDGTLVGSGRISFDNQEGIFLSKKDIVDNWLPFLKFMEEREEDSLVFYQLESFISELTSEEKPIALKSFRECRIKSLPIFKG